MKEALFSAEAWTNVLLYGYDGEFQEHSGKIWDPTLGNYVIKDKSCVDDAITIILKMTNCSK